jgi:DNA repair protein RecN (Recombination protein N)
MIRFLSIRHLAVIDALEVEFEAGLNVLTGETGAGKSIVVGAVGLLVGDRASADLVRTGETTATIQAVFETPEGHEIVARRELSAQGRSRAFLDDELVTTGALRARLGLLVDLHGQHEHQLLLDPATHLDLVDAFGGLEEARAGVGEAFHAWRALRAELDALQLDEREKAARMDLLTFQLGEIERAAPAEGEDEALAVTRGVLANADRLQRLAGEAYEGLYEGEQAALGSLQQVWKRLEELAALDARFDPYLEPLASVKVQLEDLAHFLRAYVSDIETSPVQLQEVEDRLALVERLKRKYGPTLPDVLERQRAFKGELTGLERGEARLAELGQELDTTRRTFLRVARALSTARRDAGVRFCRAIERALEELAMHRTRCEVRFGPEASESRWTERGIDVGELYLSPNPGEDLRPLAKIASGGELSRLTLAMKTLASTDVPGKTLVFDEVDAGIGGAVADVVGGKLRQLGRTCQVLCITHLPQIAAHGDVHFRIDKPLKGGRAVTTVKRVDGETRDLELARMIGGAAITESVLASARQMRDKQGSRGEQKAKRVPEGRPRPRRVENH